MPPDASADASTDVRAPSPLARLAARLGPPRDYRLTRWLILRLLGVVYLFAFVGIVLQGPALIGEHGLTPAATYVERLRAAGQGFWDVPSVLFAGASDEAIVGWAWVGVVLSAVVVIGYANLPILVGLWFVYGSFVRVGQLWWGFGWEIQLLETTVVAALLVHPWDPRPLRAPAPPAAAIVLMRWLALRVMLGAGLIKLRGDACWTELTCLDAHFATQPIPSPLSAWFHDLPHGVLAAGVAFNHVAELVLPLFVFGPRRLRLVAGVGMAAFQLVLIASGNLAFLNWLTLVPILACFDDDFLRRLVPRRLRARLERPPPPPRDGKQLAIAFGIALVAGVIWMPAFGAHGAVANVVVAGIAIAAAIVLARRFRAHLASPGHRLDGHQLLVAAVAAVIALKSVDVVGNLLSARQAMNRSYDRLALVNTYGAFGTVTQQRHELVIEGTRDPDPTAATWHAYELPCKPTALDRRPCVLGPYHRRLDWLIWFAAMAERPGDAWIVHFIWKLLDGDPTIRTLLAHDPFAGERPTFVRIRRFRYHLQPPSAATWWTRTDEQLWVPPMSRDDPYLRDVLARYGWPSPSRR